MWYVLGGVTVVLLGVYFSKGQNSVWGGFGIGVIIGLVIAIFFREGFQFLYVGQAATVGTLVGFGVDILGRTANHFHGKASS